jgi:hypothetical protein
MEKKSKGKKKKHKTAKKAENKSLEQNEEEKTAKKDAIHRKSYNLFLENYTKTDYSEERALNKHLSHLKSSEFALDFKDFTCTESELLTNLKELEYSDFMAQSFINLIQNQKHSTNNTHKSSEQIDS